MRTSHTQYIYMYVCMYPHVYLPCLLLTPDPMLGSLPELRASGLAGAGLQLAIHGGFDGEKHGKNMGKSS
jgi:hypothetical protein